eukprot:scaffold148399_cov36-Tisochrysis_lutea.AAC.1
MAQFLEHERIALTIFQNGQGVILLSPTAVVVISSSCRLLLRCAQANVLSSTRRGVGQYMVGVIVIMRWTSVRSRTAIRRLARALALYVMYEMWTCYGYGVSYFLYHHNNNITEH